VVLGGCGAMGPKYIEPPDSAEAVKVTFATTVKANNVSVRAFYGNKKCSSYFSGYRVATLNDVTIYSTGNVQEASIQFSVGVPVVMTIGSAFFRPGSGYTGRCYAHAKFTPASGKEYKVEYLANEVRCWLDVYEISKGTPPRKLEHPRIPLVCSDP